MHSTPAFEQDPQDGTTPSHYVVRPSVSCDQHTDSPAGAQLKAFDRTRILRRWQRIQATRTRRFLRVLICEVAEFRTGLAFPIAGEDSAEGFMIHQNLRLLGARTSDTEVRKMRNEGRRRGTTSCRYVEEAGHHGQNPSGERVPRFGGVAVLEHRCLRHRSIVLTSAPHVIEQHVDMSCYCSEMCV